MPTPIGHALGGAIVALLAAPRRHRTPSRAPAAPGAPGAPGHRTEPIAPVAPGASASARSQPSRELRRDLAEAASGRDGGPLVLCSFAACLPDLDFFWGRHNMETHSLGFAVVVGLAVLAWRRSGRLALAAGLAVASHVLFDWLGSDTTPPLGVMALWPLTSDYYFANAFVFEAISRRYWLPNFVSHNLLAVLREVAILLPVAAALLWRARRQ